MKFFLDSANIAEIAELNDYNLIDGVTTNPSLMAKNGQDFTQTIKEICSIISGPVSAEVTAEDFSTMKQQAYRIAEYAENIVIKLPLTLDGLKLCRDLSNNNIKTNVTLCFSANQALLAAKAGATYISPFIGRLEDIGEDGLTLIAEIREIYNNYPELNTEILAASIRNLTHIKQAALLGADVATMPAKLIKAMNEHHLTSKGLEIFKNDWQKSGLKI